ncbi:MAG: SirB2 family protein [Mariprofundaceae bacterium]
MELLKPLHISFALLSFGLFSMRGIWMWRESPLLDKRLWARWVPDFIDTTLLASGLLLMYRSNLFPDTQLWLAAKMTALVLYIILGSIAIKRGPTKRIRTAAWVSASLIFIYIIGVAIRRDAASWISLL